MKPKMITFQEIADYARAHALGTLTPIRILIGEETFFLGEVTVEVQGEEKREVKMFLKPLRANLYKNLFDLEHQINIILKSNDVRICDVYVRFNHIVYEVKKMVAGNEDVKPLTLIC